VRVGIDLQLARGTATGIGEYARGLHAALRARGLDAVALSCALDPWRFDRRLAWDQVLLPLAAARSCVDLLHCASGTMPLVASVPAVVTVHDVAWLRVQDHTRPYARAYFGGFSLARYRRARRILVDSAFSRDELLDVAPLARERIDVVYPGVAADVMAIHRARDDDAPFVLAVGTVERRKNLAVLVRAMRALPRLRLVAVGPPTPYRDVCAALARELGVADRVDLRGYVDRATLLGLYSRALVAAVPSRYEGFGYGAAQALCAGVPVIAARTSSLPEVVGDAGALVDADDAEAWAAALDATAREPEAAEARAAAARPAARARFAWDAAAAATAAAYARALVHE
jgi:glycosyltransferase involved in cell wall biosynthesis